MATGADREVHGIVHSDGDSTSAKIGSTTVYTLRASAKVAPSQKVNVSTLFRFYTCLPRLLLFLRQRSVPASVPFCTIRKQLAIRPPRVQLREKRGPRVAQSSSRRPHHTRFRAARARVQEWQVEIVASVAQRAHALRTTKHDGAPALKRPTWRDPISARCTR